MLAITIVGVSSSCHRPNVEAFTRTAPDTRVLAKGQDNRSILSATQSNTWSIVIQAWFVILATLFGIGVLTIDRYDVWRVLLPIAIGWYLLGALLLGYREEHL